MAPPQLPASGQGLLDARAIWASIVGPQRFAMGAKRTFVLKSTETLKIGDNIAVAGVYVLIGVQAVDQANNLIGLFSKDDNIGQGSGFPVVLAGPGFSATPFTQLLLPGEQLFAQLSPELVANNPRVIVSQVTF